MPVLRVRESKAFGKNRYGNRCGYDLLISVCVCARAGVRACARVYERVCMYVILLKTVNYHQDMYMLMKHPQCSGWVMLTLSGTTMPTPSYWPLLTSLFDELCSLYIISSHWDMARLYILCELGCNVPHHASMFYRDITIYCVSLNVMTLIMLPCFTGTLRYTVWAGM